MVDEVTSHNKELMPLCIRFVDEQKDIREEFIQFSTLVRVTGDAIAAQICNDLEGLNLDIKNVRGQGYDGASNMSSERIGVQTLIIEYGSTLYVGMAQKKNGGSIKRVQNLMFRTLLWM